MNNASITAGFGFYEGTANDVKRQFGLTHKGLPIFNRNFDGSDTTITNTTTDKITIPNHFFVTGEPVNYSVGIDTHVRIALNLLFHWNGTTSLYLQALLFLLSKIMILQ